MKSIQMIILISAIALFFTSALAQSSEIATQTMKSKHHGNMSSMGELMQKIADTLKNQNMSAEQLKECAVHMERLSKLMKECGHDKKLENVETQKKELNNLTREWDYFESKEFESH